MTAKQKPPGTPPSVGRSEPLWLEPRDRANRTHFQRRLSLRERSREQTMRDWYGADVGRGEIRAHRRAAEPIGKAVDKVLGRLGMTPHVLMGELQEHWVEVVGADIARQAVPAAIRGNCLDIEVSNSAWMFELRTMHEPTIRARVREFSKGKLTTVRLVPHGRRGRFEGRGAQQ